MTRPVNPPGGKTELGELFERVYWPRKRRGRSANNLRLYRNALANLRKYLGRSPTIDDLDDDLLGAWLPWFIEHGRGEETANKNLRHVLALWRFLARKRIVEQFPSVDFLETKQRVPKAWLRFELSKVFDSAAKERGVIAGVHAAYWWRCLLFTIWFTGERITAVLGMRWEDYDRQTGWIIARAEVRKGGRKDKAFPLPKELCELLEKLRQPGEPLIFSWHLKWSYWTSIYYHYNRILRRAGLPTDRNSKFHRIRKTMASYLHLAGGDATAALDHASGTTTKKWYLDPRICSDKTAADLLFDPSSPIAKMAAWFTFMAQFIAEVG